MSSDEDDSRKVGDDYEVGYKRPPKHGQFRKGESGNPAGRPKRSTDLAEIIERGNREEVTVREGARERQLPAEDAAMLAQMNKAMEGDQRAFKAVIAKVINFGLLERDDGKTSPRFGVLLLGPQLSIAEWEAKYGAQQQALLENPDAHGGDNSE